MEQVLSLNLDRLWEREPQDPFEQQLQVSKLHTGLCTRGCKCQLAVLQWIEAVGARL